MNLPPPEAAAPDSIPETWFGLPLADARHFPKSRHLLESGEFRVVLARGRRVSSPLFTVHGLTRDNGPVRLGLTVSRKVGPAVTRNRIKRLTRELFRHVRFTTPRDLVVAARPAARTASNQILLADLARLLRTFLP